MVQVISSRFQTLRKWYKNTEIAVYDERSFQKGFISYGLLFIASIFIRLVGEIPNDMKNTVQVFNYLFGLFFILNIIGWLLYVVNILAKVVILIPFLTSWATILWPIYFTSVFMVQDIRLFIRQLWLVIGLIIANLIYQLLFVGLVDKIDKLKQKQYIIHGPMTLAILFSLLLLFFGEVTDNLIYFSYAVAIFMFGMGTTLTMSFYKVLNYWNPPKTTKRYGKTLNILDRSDKNDD